MQEKSTSKRKTMKLSLLRYKITFLFVILTAVLLMVSLLYDNKNSNYVVYVNGQPTEYVASSSDGIEKIKLSVIKDLGAFVYNDSSEQKTIIVTPKDDFYIVDYVTKTVTNYGTDEDIEVTFLGTTIDDVIINIENIREMGGYGIVEDPENKSINIINEKEFTLSEKLIKQEKYSYFNHELILQYFEYMMANPKLQGVEAIIAVNEGLYRPFYENTIVVSEPNDYTVLVNKYSSLASVYEPVDLVQKGDNRFLRQSAYKALDEVNKQMQKSGLQVYLISAYRGYDRQKTLYDNYAAKDGVENADTYSARPGFSEHQTGLAMDVLGVETYSGDLEDAGFENTKEYKWLTENGYKYGLILRFPKGQENVTGYMYEPWHWRYVGEDVASFMHENNITTLEEYHALKGAEDEKFPTLSQSPDIAEAVTQKFTLNNNSAMILGYEVEGNSYYNLKDISEFLDKTKYQYSVEFEEKNNIINLLKSFGSGEGENYAEISEHFKPYRKSQIEIYVDNFAVETTYNQYLIDGEMYISLVDLSNILGFNLTWNYNTNSFDF